MGHAEIDNQTPFAAELLFSFEETGRPVVVPIIKGSFRIQPGAPLALAEKQAAVCLAGERTDGGPAGHSSWRHEPELAFTKLATDLVLLGHAHAPRRGTTQLDVQLRVGPLATSVHVVGDRTWDRPEPRPFETLPLVYERAYGGWDRTSADPSLHACEPRNPVGVGFKSKHTRKLPGHWALPNLETPGAPVLAGGPQLRPLGLGFIGADWQPRRALAGTYDEVWQKTRAPRLPQDFDRRFFNAASPGLIAPGFLRGDELVQTVHATPMSHLAFALPGVAPPQVRLFPRSGGEVELVSRLDTVVIDLDGMHVYLTWRVMHVLRNGPHDVLALTITSENVAALFPAKPLTAVVPVGSSRLRSTPVES